MELPSSRLTVNKPYASFLHRSFYFHDAQSLMPQKQRRLFPSRMLSMIADEEMEGSDGALPVNVPSSSLGSAGDSTDNIKGLAATGGMAADEVYVGFSDHEESVTEVWPMDSSPPTSTSNQVLVIFTSNCGASCTKSEADTWSILW